MTSEGCEKNIYKRKKKTKDFEFLKWIQLNKENFKEFKVEGRKIRKKKKDSEKKINNEWMKNWEWNNCKEKRNKERNK